MAADVSKERGSFISTCHPRRPDPEGIVSCPHILGVSYIYIYIYIYIYMYIAYSNNLPR